MSKQPEPANSSSNTSHETDFHDSVTGPIHTGSGNINIHPSVERIEQTQSKKESSLESTLNYLGKSSVGRAIKGPLRFTLAFAFIVGSVLFVKWIFPPNTADTLISIYLFALLIWWIIKEEDEK